MIWYSFELQTSDNRLVMLILDAVKLHEVPRNWDQFTVSIRLTCIKLKISDDCDKILHELHILNRFF